VNCNKTITEDLIRLHNVANHTVKYSSLTSLTEANVLCHHVQKSVSTNTIRMLHYA